MCVCPVYALTYDSLDLKLYLCQVRMSRSSGQGQVHRSKVGEICERKTVVTCEIKRRYSFPIISAAERVLKLFQNYFSDNEHVGKYSRAATSL